MKLQVHLFGWFFKTPYPDSSKQVTCRLADLWDDLIAALQWGYKRAGVEHAQGHVVLGHVGMAFNWSQKL